MLQMYLSQDSSQESAMQAYYQKCVELCWLMVVQDPPVVMLSEVNKEATFDRNVWKEYTRSGHTVEYIVWPALLLRDSGPVLAKGVIQPIKPEPKGSKVK